MTIILQWEERVHDIAIARSPDPRHCGDLLETVSAFHNHWSSRVAMVGAIKAANAGIDADGSSGRWTGKKGGERERGAYICS